MNHICTKLDYKKVKTTKLTGGNFINNEKEIMCMNCYHQSFTSSIFRYNPIEKPNKMIKIGTCPKCGQLIKYEINYYKCSEIKTQINKLDLFKEEIERIEKIKGKFEFFQNYPDHYKLKFVPGPFYEAIKGFDKDKTSVNQGQFETYLKLFFKLRKFYKHIVRKKFMYDSLVEESGETYQDAALKYQYCNKLQNTMIYGICKNRNFFTYWFTDYTKLNKLANSFNKKVKREFAYYLLNLGRLIEEFEFLNYDIVFGELDFQNEKELEIYGGCNNMPIYLSKNCEDWLYKMRDFVGKMKFTRIGTDSAKEETPVNDGVKSHQLTKEMRVEYNRIIEEQHKKENEKGDNQILKEMEEEFLMQKLQS